MFKRLLMGLIILSLTGCIPNYDRKHDEYNDYYTDFLDENGIVEYIKEPASTSDYTMNAIYRIYEIDANCESNSIMLYYGIEESTGKSVTVYMPDKVGEPNIIVYDLIYDLDELRSVVQEYNQNESNLEIRLDESHIRLRTVNFLWRDLVINEVKQEVDEESIQAFAYSTLSHPMIYQVGNIYGNDIEDKYIFLGLNKDNEYVLFSQTNDHNTLEVVYTFPSSTNND